MARTHTAQNVTARHYAIWKGVNAALESINSYTEPAAGNEDALRMKLRSEISNTQGGADRTLRERIVKALGEHPQGEPGRKILLPKTGAGGSGDRICIVEDAPDMDSLRGEAPDPLTEKPQNMTSVPQSGTTSGARTIVNELEQRIPRVAEIMEATDARKTEPVWLAHHPLYGEVFRNSEVSQAQGQFAHLGETLERLHYAVFGYFHDVKGYHKERRIAELLNDVKTVLTLPSCKQLWSLEGVRDIHLTNWVSDAISQYNGYSADGQLLFQLQNRAHIFMHFEIVHVYPKQGPIQRMARGGRHQ